MGDVAVWRTFLNPSNENISDDDLAACRAAEQKALTRSRRIKVLVAGLAALLGLSGPTVLTVEQEKAKAAKPGSDFKECANGCPVMIVVPAGKFMMGSPENESGPGSQ